MARHRAHRLNPLPGTVATFVALTIGYWLPGIGLPRLDFPLLNGNLLVPDTTAVSFAWTVGLAQTLGIGVLLGLMYGEWARERLPGGPATKGAIWGLVVGCVAGFTVFPLLYGGGLFGSRWDTGTPMALVAWFLAWGATLGLADGG